MMNIYIQYKKVNLLFFIGLAAILQKTPNPNKITAYIGISTKIDAAVRVLQDPKIAATYST
ncbi:MAG: hypothetical protein ABIK15_02570 [Pseudomonadota bacterium]